MSEPQSKVPKVSDIFLLSRAQLATEQQKIVQLPDKSRARALLEEFKANCALKLPNIGSFSHQDMETLLASVGVPQQQHHQAIATALQEQLVSRLCYGVLKYEATAKEDEKKLIYDDYVKSRGVALELLARVLCWINSDVYELSMVPCVLLALVNDVPDSALRALVTELGDNAGWRVSAGDVRLCGRGADQLCPALAGWKQLSAFNAVVLCRKSLPLWDSYVSSLLPALFQMCLLDDATQSSLPRARLPFEKLEEDDLIYDKLFNGVSLASSAATEDTLDMTKILNTKDVLESSYIDFSKLHSGKAGVTHISPSMTVFHHLAHCISLDRLLFERLWLHFQEHESQLFNSLSRALQERLVQHLILEAPDLAMDTVPMYKEIWYQSSCLKSGALNLATVKVLHEALKLTNDPSPSVSLQHTARLAAVLAFPSFQGLLLHNIVSYVLRVTETDADFTRPRPLLDFLIQLLFLSVFARPIAVRLELQLAGRLDAKLSEHIAQLESLDSNFSTQTFQSQRLCAADVTRTRVEALQLISDLHLLTLVNEADIILKPDVVAKCQAHDGIFLRSLLFYYFGTCLSRSEEHRVLQMHSYIGQVAELPSEQHQAWSMQAFLVEPLSYLNPMQALQPGHLHRDWCAAGASLLGSLVQTVTPYQYSASRPNSVLRAPDASSAAAERVEAVKTLVCGERVELLLDHTGRHYITTLAQNVALHSYSNLQSSVFEALTVRAKTADAQNAQAATNTVLSKKPATETVLTALNVLTRFALGSFYETSPDTTTLRFPVRDLMRALDSIDLQGPQSLIPGTTAEQEFALRQQCGWELTALDYSLSAEECKRVHHTLGQKAQCRPRDLEEYLIGRRHFVDTRALLILARTVLFSSVLSTTQILDSLQLLLGCAATRAAAVLVAKYDFWTRVEDLQLERPDSACTPANFLTCDRENQGAANAAAALDITMLPAIVADFRASSLAVLLAEHTPSSLIHMHPATALVYLGMLSNALLLIAAAQASDSKHWLLAPANLIGIHHLITDNPNIWPLPSIVSE